MNIIWNLDYITLIKTKLKYIFKGDYFATSNGLGKSRLLDNIQYTRKSIKDLINYTKTLNDEELMTINAMTEATITPIFVAGEDF